jgi:hypothetical protein
MSDFSWKTPAAILGIVTALATIVGLYFTFQSNQSEEQKNKYQIERDSLEDWKVSKTEEDIERQQQEKKDNLLSRMTDIESQIQTCRDNVERANAEIYLSCGEVDAEHETRCQAAKDYRDSNMSTWKQLEEQQKEIQDRIDDL